MNRIKNLRLENGLSLRELARELNISYSSLGKYERGEQEPSFETLEKISERFHVTADYLLGFSNVKNPKYVEIHKELGLTDTSIEIIKKNKENIAPGLNSFIQNPMFPELIELYTEYSMLGEISAEDLESMMQTSYGYDSFDLNNPLDLAARNLMDKFEKLPSTEAYKMYILNIFNKLLDNTTPPTD